MRERALFAPFLRIHFTVFSRFISRFPMSESPAPRTSSRLRLSESAARRSAHQQASAQTPMHSIYRFSSAAVPASVNASARRSIHLSLTAIPPYRTSSHEMNPLYTESPQPFILRSFRSYTSPVCASIIIMQ